MSGRLDLAGVLGGDGAIVAGETTATAGISGSRTDAALCRRVREHGDDEAFRELVRRHRRAYYAVVNGFRSAEHLVERDDQEQEALIAFWNTARAYDHTWRAPYGAIASGDARRRLIGAVRHALRQKERANREAARLDAQLSDETTTTLGETVPAPAGFWEPEAIAEIRHELRVLSTELPQALSPTEREAMERLMLGERARQACGSAVTRLRAKAAAVLNGTTGPVARWARVQRRYEWEQTARRTEAERKRQAVAMVRDGHTYTTAGAAVGADRRTIARWVQQANRDQLDVAA